MKYIDAERLKAEIDNLESFSCIQEEQDGFYSAISRVIDIIDSLQQEQPEVDLENEISTWIPAHIRGGDDGVWNTKNAVIEWAGIVARHFYELGKKAMKEQFEKNRLANCDKLTKEEYDLETDFATEIIEKEHRQPTFTDAINYGMRVMKEYLMKEAVEGFFTKSIDGEDVFAESTALDVDPKSVKVGDKVKLIVIKED